MTLYILTLAVYKVLLRRWSGAGDFAVGAPIAGRRHPETQNMIGLFMNMLVMRTDLSGNPSFRELLTRVRKTVLEALDHQDLPFGHLIADLAPQERTSGQVPLVQVLFNYLQRSDAREIDHRGDLVVQFENTDLLAAGTGEFDLVLGITDAAGELQCTLSYDANRFNRQTIEWLAEQMLAMLESVADNPALPINDPEVLIRRENRQIPLKLNGAGDRAIARHPWRSGIGTPVFCIHGLGGHVAGFIPLARKLAVKRAVYGLQGLGLDPGQEPHERIEYMGEFYLREIRRTQLAGPYLLCGWSMGGLIALETARQMLAAGQGVALVAMLDTYLSTKEFEKEVDDQSVLLRIAPQLGVPAAELKKLPLAARWDRIAELAQRASGIGIEDIRRIAAVCKAHLRALARHQLQPYAGPCVLFSADQLACCRSQLSRWKKHCPALRLEPVPGNHYSMLREPHVDALAEHLDLYLQQAESGTWEVASGKWHSPLPTSHLSLAADNDRSGKT